MQGFESLAQRLASFSASPDFPHDIHIAACIKEALATAKEGNFGVGAVLVQGATIVETGRNHVFQPYFQSDRHAEMDVMTRIERKRKGHYKQHKGYTLFTSVEPCTMCFARLITSGIEEVFYAADDSEGGMVHLQDNLPNAWKGLLKGGGATFAPALCSPELKDLAMDVFLTTVRQLDKILAEGE